MRTLIVVAALAAATPAAAQLNSAILLNQQAQQCAAELAARQRDIAVTNELSRLEAQMQSTQALSDLAAQRTSPQITILPRAPGAPPPKLDASKLVQIPDAALADSNAKVRAAAENRR
jgi:hypothetical protein